jgi:hypothetical protein
MDQPLEADPECLCKRGHGTALTPVFVIVSVGGREGPPGDGGAAPDLGSACTYDVDDVRRSGM